MYDGRDARTDGEGGDAPHGHVVTSPCKEQSQIEPTMYTAMRKPKKKNPLNGLNMTQKHLRWVVIPLFGHLLCLQSGVSFIHIFKYK